MLLARIKIPNRSSLKMVMQTSLRAKLNAIRSMIAQLSNGMVPTVTKKKTPTRDSAFLQLQNGINPTKQLKATQVTGIRTQNALLDKKIVMAMGFHLITGRDPLFGRK